MATTTEYTLTVEDTATIPCCNCGLVFVVPGAWDRAKRKSHEGFFCPNGHPLAYKGETAEEKKIRQLEASRKFYQDYARDEREAKERARRSLAATKGVLTRTRNRIAKGVCPCCKRTFGDLAAHMAGHHPEYARATADAPADPNREGE